MPKPIYLDYNATTPHDPEVIAAMRPFLEEEFGNPSSGHWYGSKPRQAVWEARRQTATALDCRRQEIIFTSGGTESNNHAIIGVAYACRDKGNHIVTSQIEHPAILAVCAHLEQNGFEVTYLAVDEHGLVNPADVAAAISPQTILITIMHANNEVGTIQPLAEISALAKPHGILVHTDAAQSLGKVPTTVDALGVDLLSVAGHKISFQGCKADRVLQKIGRQVAASAGAACHSDTVEISHVLKAMQVPLDWAGGTLRLTTGRHTSAEDIDGAVQVIVEAVNRS